MKINNRRLREYNAILNSFTYNTCELEVDVYSVGMKQFILNQNITPQNRDLIVTFESEIDASRFTSLLLNTPLIIDTEDGYLYDCIMISTPTTEHLGCEYYKITYHFSCVKKGRRIGVQVSRKNKSVHITGNQMISPIITIKPLKDIESIKLMDITINRIHKGKNIMIDSTSKLIEEDGKNKFNDTDMKQWPSLSPGTHTIEISSMDVAVLLEYEPIYF